MILHLRTETENELLELLEPYGFRINNDWVTVVFIEDKRYNLDIIGTIYIQVGKEHKDGFDIPIMEAIPGFHANLLWPDDVSVSDDIQKFTIEPPKTPHRIFA